MALQHHATHLVQLGIWRASEWVVVHGTPHGGLPQGATIAIERQNHLAKSEDAHQVPMVHDQDGAQVVVGHGLHRLGQRRQRHGGVERGAFEAKNVADFHGVPLKARAAGMGFNIAHNQLLVHRRNENTMTGYADPHFDTLTLHAGSQPDPATGARAVPIHLTTSYVFESSDQAAALFNLESAGHVYSRISNPTNAVLEQRIAALEGGIGAIATASGQAALHLAISTLMGAGSHIVASSALYGGSHNLLHYTLSRFGIETTFVKPGDLDAWRNAVKPNTKLFFGETVGNPGMDVLDLPAVSQIAHAAGVPLLVDATLTSPWLMKPLEHGADLIVHSATKFLSGHGTVIGGLVVDGGSFDWSGPNTQGKFAELTQAYEGFHNMVFDEESTVGAFLLRARREGLRDFGACMSPHTAWLILQGIETLPLRMARHVSNTEKIVNFLAAHPMVSRVGHPMLETHPSYALAQKLLPRGAGSVFSFDIRGTRAQGKAFIEALQVFSHLANVGDCRSLVIHPASTTHFRVDDETLKASGIGPGTVRLSIGLEDPDDLVDDLKRALKAAEKAATPTGGAA